MEVSKKHKYITYILELDETEMNFIEKSLRWYLTKASIWFERNDINDMLKEISNAKYGGDEDEE